MATSSTNSASRSGRGCGTSARCAERRGHVSEHLPDRRRRSTPRREQLGLRRRRPSGPSAHLPRRAAKGARSRVASTRAESRANRRCLGALLCLLAPALPCPNLRLSLPTSVLRVPVSQFARRRSEKEKRSKTQKWTTLRRRRKTEKDREKTLKT